MEDIRRELEQMSKDASMNGTGCGCSDKKERKKTTESYISIEDQRAND